MDIKTKYTIKFPIIEGIEKLKKIDILEDNTIIIQYTITNEFMKQNDLYNKNRILKIDTSKTEEWQVIQDYANIMEG